MTEVKNLRQPFSHLVKRHPCLGGGPDMRNGRLHLPVSPACNLQCRFCQRRFNDVEERPGVTRGILGVEQVPAVLARALELCPEISVVGIAGPGDTLASDHAIRAFQLVHQLQPGLIKCLSTNGLLLEERLPELLAVGVSTLTVTVNGVTPDTVARVVASVAAGGRRLEAPAGARLLVERQLAGIRAAASAGLLVKVNMVLVPGVNDGEVAATAQAVKEAGAWMFNLIPLLPQGEFAELPAPSCADLHAARTAAEAHLLVFRHCQHCRADAVGIPGVSDHSEAIYGSLGRPVETFSHG
jgi:nitrogen fixation protein NifB